MTNKCQTRYLGIFSWRRSTRRSLKVVFLTNLVDLFKYFSQYGPIESIKLHREGAYGFLLYLSRVGTLNLFEAGEIHTIKGFKIECRKTMNRDNIKNQTVPTTIPTVIHKEQVSKSFASQEVSVYPVTNKESILDTTANSSKKSATNKSSKPLKLKGQHFNPTTETSSIIDSSTIKADIDDSMYSSGFHLN